MNQVIQKGKPKHWRWSLRKNLLFYMVLERFAVWL